MKKVVFFIVCFLFLIVSKEILASWGTIPSPVSKNLKSINYINAIVPSLYTVGDSGTIMKSDHPTLGFNWRSLPSPTNQNLIGLGSFQNTLPIFALSSKGVVLKSTNGENWSVLSEIQMSDSLNLVGIFTTSDKLYIYGNVNSQFHGFEQSTIYLYIMDNVDGSYTETVIPNQTATSMFDWNGEIIIAGRDMSNPFTNGRGFLMNVETSVRYSLENSWQDYEIVSAPKQGSDQYLVLNLRTPCGESQRVVRLNGLDSIIILSDFSKEYYLRGMCGYAYTEGVKCYLTQIGKIQNFIGIGNSQNIIRFSPDSGYSSIEYQGLAPLRSMVQISTHHIVMVGDNGLIVGKIDIPLPVELYSFTSMVNGNNVQLNWTTSSEINNSHFVVERKEIANTAWIAVTTITGNGTVSSPMSYSFTDRNLSSGNYNYRLKQIDYNGNYEYFDLSNEVIIGIPDKFVLSQNYPNPFNPSTTISYSISSPGQVNIKIFDLSGKEVMTAVNEYKPAGHHSAVLNASNLPSGVYYYTLNSQGFADTKKMVLIK